MTTNVESNQEHVHFQVWLYMGCNAQPHKDGTPIIDDCHKPPGAHVFTGFGVGWTAMLGQKKSAVMTPAADNHNVTTTTTSIRIGQDQYHPTTPTITHLPCICLHRNWSCPSSERDFVAALCPGHVRDTSISTLLYKANASPRHHSL